MKYFRTALLGSLLAVATIAGAASPWDGYINNKTFKDRSYGYLFAGSVQAADKKLRLICQAPGVFELFFHVDTNITADTVHMTVDRLPAMSFTVSRNGDDRTISDQTELFWPLMAQLVAGAQLKVQWSDTTAILRYDLAGFTDTYTRVCGWLDPSTQYLPYLSSYR